MNYTFDNLLDIVEKLRGDNGCPWDKEQTFESLKRYVIEEAYEVIDEVDSGNSMALADELGDLLLQVIMYAQIGKEKGEFDISSVLNCVCNKMITRHPHVFGDVKADTSDEVLKNWAAIKKKEKGQTTHTETMRGISSSIPSLLRACKVQEEASKAGFDWDSMEGAFSKLKEEVSELEAEIGNKEAFQEELGDLLFAAVNVARFGKTQPEMALSGGISKFIDRFEKVENTCISRGLKMEDMSLSQLDEIWEEIKK